jgi:hypothetical protein
MKINHNSILAAAFLCVSSALGQKPNQEQPPPPVQATEFKPVVAQGPGGGTWLKLLTSFSSSPEWADGIAFYYEILVKKEDQYRVLSGTARYANVKKGKHIAVLYMSPSAVARFGSPVAAQIGVGYNDEVAEPLIWNAPGTPAPKGWVTQYQRYSDLVLPIYLTPFVATEFGNYPDPIISR